MWYESKRFWSMNRVHTRSSSGSATLNASSARFQDFTAWAGSPSAALSSACRAASHATVAGVAFLGSGAQCLREQGPGPAVGAFGGWDVAPVGQSAGGDTGVVGFFGCSSAVS